MERLTGNETVSKVGGSDVRPVGAWAAQAALIVIAGYVVISARGLGVWLPQGPGPGFFPLVLAVAMIVLSVAWFVQTRRAAGGDSAEDAGAYPWKRPAVTLASLVVLAAVLNLLGFQAGMLLFLVPLPYATVPPLTWLGV